MSEEHDARAKRTFQVVDRRRFDADGRERQQETEPVRVAVGPSSAATSPTANSTAAIPSDGASSVRSTIPADGAIPPQDELRGDPAITQQFLLEEGDGEESEVSFTSFLMSLATQALVQIGEMDPPEGMEIPLDVEAGRQTIDILSMLQRKTRGNLSHEEARFLEEVLHTLRMSYVRRAR